MTGTHTLAALASSGTNYTPIGIVAAIFVPICAAVAVTVWNDCSGTAPTPSRWPPTAS